MTELNQNESDGAAGAPPVELDERFHEATRLSDEEQWSESFDLLRELEEEFPDDPMLLATLGTVAGEVEARGLAYDYFRRSLAAHPTDPAVLVLLGAGLARFDDPEAEGILRLAAIGAPQLAAARYQYGAYLAREGQHELALRELGAARELEPGDPLVVRELGVAQWLAGDAGQAAATLEEAAALAPDDAEARLLSGLVQLSADRTEEGAAEVVRASEELPDDGEVQIVASLAAAAEGWLDEAWNALARAEGAIRPADPEVVAEAEEALEAGEEEARELLVGELLPRLLHDRLLERP